MTREEVSSSIQFAIEHLVVALENISQIDEIVKDTERGLEIAVSTERGTHDIVIFEDQSLVFTPGHKTPNEFRSIVAHGRPPGLPLKTCPRCNGKGKI